MVVLHGQVCGEGRCTDDVTVRARLSIILRGKTQVPFHLLFAWNVIKKNTMFEKEILNVVGFLYNSLKTNLKKL
jgi:hypothetical protein